MARTFIAKIMWYIKFKRDQIFKTINNTATRLQEEEDNGKQEAWKYSVSKRKYLFDDRLKETKSATMDIFRNFYFLFKSFVKVELSYVFTINLFTIGSFTIKFP